ncbi:MAG TPA: T9SS type A sorting domain-containing protein [Paludibacteraceae bacterium]|nr:T9SS type A sorting domain-containing protein [Paludibacteraceae bacterium]HQF50953.1 T9SS type A sorting domain-containing protein [Paludibacteraceae bacterium]
MKHNYKSLMKSLCIVASLFLAEFVMAGSQLAFPGALGFGQSATGGRSGKVYHVTNLNDSGTGSFRDAVSSSNRIVVFDVSGHIRLKTAVTINSNVTIAGQTAPGEGISLDGGKLSCGGKSNIIIRHLRIRPGSETASVKDDGLNMYRSQNCIIDHCSVEFSPWNNIGGSGSNDYKSTNITFQYCLIADPIYQQFGAHIESVNSQWTWYGNCFANTHNRNPLEKINDVFVNNVLYNYQGGYTTHTSTNFKHDIVNNYFVGGPSSGSTDNTWFQVDKNQSIYYSGNMKDRNNDGVLNGTGTTPYWYQGTGTVLSSPWSEQTNLLSTISAASAFRMVASRAGVQPWDDMDRLIMGQVQSVGKSGAMYTSQTATGLTNDGYGAIASVEKPADADNDGMPDFWELAMDLNPSKDDAMAIGSDGYANIEVYVNWLAMLHEKVEANSSLNVDLAGYVPGWSKVSSTYKVSGAKNGVVSLSGSNATFVPDMNYSGLASFDFTVTGTDNTSFTTTVYVLVLKGENVVYENPTLTKQGGGSSSQSLFTNESIQNFSFLWENAATVEVKWTPCAPEGVVTMIDKLAKTVTFSGTPLVCGSYAYEVVTVGAVTTVSRTGTIDVNPHVCVYENVTDNASDWSVVDSWKNKMLPYDCDTAIVRTGEVNVNADVRAVTYVENEGVFRIRTNVAVRELHLNGGILKSYTSNPEFRLTVSELSIDQPSVFICGSLDTSVFKVSGKMTGVGDVTKTKTGVLMLNADASAFSGRWYLQEGTIRLTNANGLGTEGVSLSAGTMLHVDVSATTGSVLLEETSKLNLDADLTVGAAYLGGLRLNKGKYSAADHPAYLKGTGYLIVTEEQTEANVVDVLSLAMNVVPNPFENEAEILITADKNMQCRLTVTNMDGTIVGSYLVQIYPLSNKFVLDLEALVPGIYFLKAESPEGIWVKKIMKK